MNIGLRSVYPAPYTSHVLTPQQPLHIVYSSYIFYAFGVGAAPDLEELLRCPVTSGRNAAAQSLAKLIAAYDPTR